MQQLIDNQGVTLQLREWLKQENIDVLHFCVQHHMSITSVYRYLRGLSPNYRTACRIEEITKGAVTVKELMKNHACRTKT